MVINGIFCINCSNLHRPTEDGVSIFLNIITQRQSVYQACSVHHVPTANIFVEQDSYFVVEGTDSNRGNMQQMVQQSVNHAI